MTKPASLKDRDTFRFTSKSNAMWSGTRSPNLSFQASQPPHGATPLWDLRTPAGAGRRWLPRGASPTPRKAAQKLSPPSYLQTSGFGTAREAGPRELELGPESGGRSAGPSRTGLEGRGLGGRQERPERLGTEGGKREVVGGPGTLRDVGGRELGERALELGEEARARTRGARGWLGDGGGLGRGSESG